jgi:Enoyl-CoA hydratase/isomerase
MLTEPITVQRDGHVLLIGINRPAQRNVVNLAAMDALCGAYEVLGDDEQLRAGVLFAHGDHFSAGLDLAEAGPAVAGHGPQVLYGSHLFDPFGVWRDPVPKPVVMAVNGIAFTLSVELALAADIVIAADDVRFRQPEIGRVSCRSAGHLPRARAARLGQRDALPAHCGGVRRRRGTADWAGGRRWCRPGRTSSGPPAWRILSRGSPRWACGPRWPARVPAPAAGRTPGVTPSPRCSPASCAARTPPKACAASSNGAKRTSPATDAIKQESQASIQDPPADRSAVAANHQQPDFQSSGIPDARRPHST